MRGLKISKQKIGRLGAIPALAVLLALAGAATVWALAGGGTINGAVDGPDGSLPPAGTVVKLFEPGSEAVFGQAAVDPASGAFSIGPVPNGLYVLKAVPPAASGLTQSAPVPVSVLGGPVTGVTLHLSRPQITGRVMQPDGNAPVTATVKVFLGSGDVLQSVPSPGGDFAVGGLPPGGYALRAYPATDDPYWQSPFKGILITGGVTKSVTLTLTRAQLWGFTRDSLGNPVANANVHAVGVTPPRQHHSDYSSGSGFWAIGGLAAGDVYLGAEPPFGQNELLAPTPYTVTLPGGENNPNILIFDSITKTVSGTVTSNLGGSAGLPVQNALVLARRIDKPGQARALSDSGGRYSLNLSAGLWAMTVRPISITTPSDWVYPQPPQLVHFEHNTEPEGKTQNFQVIVADAQVIGSVQLPGSGTLGLPQSFTVTVALFNAEGIGQRTAIQVGESFSLNVPNGGYKVVVYPHSPAYLGPVVPPIEVEPGGVVDLGALTLLAKDAAITGAVGDGAGNGVAGIPVVAWRAGTLDTLRTRTGPDGAYILPVVAGRWQVQPAPAPQQPYLYTGSGATVALTSGQVITGVRFNLLPAGAAINGQLVDETGAPLSDVDGWAAAANTADPALRNGAPVQAGNFTIFVPAGNYNVAAYLPAGASYMSGAAKNVSVRDGEAVTITLELLAKDATIAGGLWDPRNQDVVEGVNGLVGAWAGNNWAGTAINAGNGSFRFTVAAGLWHLSYRIDPTSGYVKLVDHKNVPVDPRQTAVVPLPVVFKDAEITGTVLDPDGSPRGGVTVAAHGFGDTSHDLTLQTLSRADGSFSLAVPYGRYRLGALGGGSRFIKPVEVEVNVEPGQTSAGHVLQFQTSDATIGGGLLVGGNNSLAGEALVWGWSDDGGFVKGRFPITPSVGTVSWGRYRLNVISNTTWHLGAVFETDTDFWSARQTVVMGSGNATQTLALDGPFPKPAPVVVTFDAADPQRIELADGTRIFIPAGAMPVSGQVTLRVVPVATLPHQQHANVYKYGYAFIAVDSAGQPIEDHFNQDVIIGFGYDDAELVQLGIVESNLKPAYYSTTADHWTFPESYAVDTANNIVTMQIDHFTDFALTAGAAESVYLPLVIK
ncbi:MAG: carboxypeptidase-like regulatory domain-containing protein, partial [Anaerolineae bacterium]